MKKSLVVAALCASAVLGGINPAQAGYWKRVLPLDSSGNPLTGQDYLDWLATEGKPYNGNETAAWPYENTSRKWEDEGTWFHQLDGGIWTTNHYYQGWNVQPYDNSLTYESSGTIRSKFKWVRNQINGNDDPNDNPPPILWIKVSFGSSASISGYGLISSSSTSLEHTVNNVESQVDTITGTNVDGVMIDRQASTYQPMLVPLITNNSDEVWTPPYPYSVKMEAQYNTEATIGIYQSMTYSSQPDDRRLYLTRTGAIGEVVRGNTTYGHSRFSYKDVLIGTPVDIPVDQEYVRHISGSWGSNPDWEWTPEGNDDAAMYSIQTNEYGNRNKNVDGHWVGTPTTPRVQTTTYRLQDPNDGTVAEAVYELILHDEWENLRKDPAKTPIAQHAYFPSGPSINLDWAENRTGVDGATGSWTQNIEVSHAFELGFDLSVSPVDLADLGFSFTESFQNTYGTSFGITSPPIPNMKHCYPYVHLHWNREHYLLDHYIPAGPHRNSLRLNTNGEIDATHDGSWEGWADDYPGGASPGWSEMYNIDDFDGDGLPD